MLEADCRNMLPDTGTTRLPFGEKYDTTVNCRRWAIPFESLQYIEVLTLQWITPEWQRSAVPKSFCTKYCRLEGW